MWAKQNTDLTVKTNPDALEEKVYSPRFVDAISAAAVIVTSTAVVVTSTTVVVASVAVTSMVTSVPAAAVMVTSTAVAVTAFVQPAYSWLKTHQVSCSCIFSGPHRSWIVFCLYLKIEFRFCDRGREW